MTSNLSIFAGGITASSTSRVIGGDVIRFGVPGRTSAGRLRVRAGALRFPEDITRVKLTKEHNRDESRGYLQAVQFFPDRIRASAKVSDGPLGDAALTEAKDKTRDGFSFDVVDAVIEGDEIVDGLVIAIGQVGIPAYDDTRIDTIAASQTPAAPTHQGDNMTPEQRARLAALRAQETRTEAEELELTTLVTLETAVAPEAAETAPAAPAAPVAVDSAPAAAPAGVPVAASAHNVEVRETGLNAFAAIVAAYMRPGQRTEAITAALADVTHTQHTDHVSQGSWSGELWSGLEYQPQFIDLFNHGDLTSWKGTGWRWGTKPAVGDYAGDKADIPTNTPTTIDSPWEAARLAGGWDIDRKFFDFPDAAFIASFLAAARESYTMKLDFKVRDYIVANAVVPASTPTTPTQTSILKAARLATKWAKRNTKGQPASFILMNDDDMDQLFDVTNDDVPAFLQLFNIDPSNFRGSSDLAKGFVYAGVKQAATVRELPGASPLRVEVQNLNKAGIDEALFGYYAIEEHHTSAIVKVPFAVS